MQVSFFKRIYVDILADNGQHHLIFGADAWMLHRLLLITVVKILTSICLIALLLCLAFGSSWALHGIVLKAQRKILSEMCICAMIIDWILNQKELKINLSLKVIKNAKKLNPKFEIWTGLFFFCAKYLFCYSFLRGSICRNDEGGSWVIVPTQNIAQNNMIYSWIFYCLLLCVLHFCVALTANTQINISRK